ncbi:hypothetical protein C7N43_31045 [Sphingobacteriales bacterium UPWRP_1]|nr:hypothetical protein BVG80_01700 [Sphingobacteriales bacterium TSM_CSM]PSJ73050.1 hypothetical protein C7N43_31045 [Sphingobacteriales bacterium UPWRP_1]
MEIIIVLLYLLLLLYLIRKLPFFDVPAMPRPVFMAAFLLKVAGGLLFIVINQRYFYDGGDSRVYFTAGKTIYNTLFQNPLHFLELTFGPNARKPPAHLAAIIENIPAWNDVRTYMIIRVNALAHLVSFHYYSIHAILGAFMGFTGLAGIYKTFAGYFPQKRVWFFVLFFATPSVLYWTSGLHKEGISLLCLGMAVYRFGLLVTNKVTPRGVVAWLVWILLLALFRPYTFGLLMPALTLWFIAQKQNYKPLPVFAAAYTAGFALLAVISKLLPKLNVFAVIADIRYYFVMYKTGGSEIDLQLMQPTWLAALQEMPRALVNTLLRPEPWGNMDVAQQLAALETLAFTLFAALCLLLANLRTSQNRAFLCCCLFFSVTSFLLIGLTTDNLGAIVRYRSILLPFWLGFWVAIANFEGIKKYYRY